MYVRSPSFQFQNTLIIFPFLLFFYRPLGAGEAVTADISFKLAPGQTSKYECTTETNTEINGRERSESFVLRTELKLDITVSLQGLLQKGPGMAVSLKIPTYLKAEKQTVGSDVSETTAGNGKIKVLQNGKIVVDSDNDIGLDQVKNFQSYAKILQDGEMRVTLDPAGKQTTEAEGDPLIIDTIRGSGAEGILRLLPGRELKPGDSWEDSETLPNLASFKLEKPVISRSKSTFVAWEEKFGKRLAKIEIVTAWQKGDLKGENSDGMSAEVTQLQGASIGTALFDPATSQFVEGQLDLTAKYKIDGKSKEGTTTTLDVASKTKFTFKQIP